VVARWLSYVAAWWLLVMFVLPGLFALLVTGSISDVFRELLGPTPIGAWLTSPEALWSLYAPLLVLVGAQFQLQTASELSMLGLAVRDAGREA